jgi:hypothetical protein
MKTESSARPCAAVRSSAAYERQESLDEAPAATARFATADLFTLRLGPATAYAKSRLSDASSVLRGRLSLVPLACRRFATLDEHIKTLLRVLSVSSSSARKHVAGWSPNLLHRWRAALESGVAAAQLRAELAQLVRQGILVTEDDYVRRLCELARMSEACERVAIPQIGIITQSRPRQLQGVLAAALRSGGVARARGA